MQCAKLYLLVDVTELHYCNRQHTNTLYYVELFFIDNAFVYPYIFEIDHYNN